MQPNFGANRGWKRRFAGDCAANSGLVDRIRRPGCREDATDKHPKPLPHASQMSLSTA